MSAHKQREDAPAPAAAPRAPANARVNLGFLVPRLVADGLLAPADAQRIVAIPDRERHGHPLVLIAEMNFRSADAERRLLDLESLTQWIAALAGLPYQHIDPLKVDFTRVVDVMSSRWT